jgi:hypothetical protein
MTASYYTVQVDETFANVNLHEQVGFQQACCKSDERINADES